jgi:hypothetical protein
MSGKGNYWRDAILFDDLDAALKDLLALEETTVGEPRWYPYHNALNALFEVMDTLHEQLRAASKNAYYKAREGRVHP